MKNQDLLINHDNVQASDIMITITLVTMMIFNHLHNHDDLTLHSFSYHVSMMYVSDDIFIATNVAATAH